MVEQKLQSSCVGKQAFLTRGMYSKMHNYLRVAIFFRTTGIEPQ